MGWACMKLECAWSILLVTLTRYHDPGFPWNETEQSTDDCTCTIVICRSNVYSTIYGAPHCPAKLCWMVILRLGLQVNWPSHAHVVSSPSSPSRKTSVIRRHLMIDRHHARCLSQERHLCCMGRTSSCTATFVYPFHPQDLLDDRSSFLDPKHPPSRYTLLDSFRQISAFPSPSLCTGRPTILGKACTFCWWCIPAGISLSCVKTALKLSGSTIMNSHARMPAMFPSWAVNWKHCYCHHHRHGSGAGALYRLKRGFPFPRLYHISELFLSTQ